MYGDHEILYISDLIKIKDEMDLWFDVILNQKEKDDIYSSLNELLQYLDSVTEWKALTEDYPELASTIFKEKHNYSIHTNEKDDEVIVVGKSSFPTISEKSMEKVSYHISYLKELSLYQLELKYNHTHFQLFMNYYAIPMKY